MFRNITARLAVGFASAALVLTGAAASASVRNAHPNVTQQCGTQVNCTTPDVYTSTGPEPALSQTVLAPNGAVITAQNDDTVAAQDWRYTDYGTVAALTNNGDGPFMFGLTSEDYTLYASDTVYGLQAAPGGFLSNLCAANIRNHLVLRRCRPHKWQRFIAATGSEFGAPLLNSDGFYGLSVVGASNAAGHKALTAGSLNTQVGFANPTGVNSQNWDNNDSSGASS